MFNTDVFMDTSFVLALENRDDPHHERARELDKELIRCDITLLLHWGILLEIADGYSRVSRRRKGIALLKSILAEPGYNVQPITHDLFTAATSRYENRIDKSWGLTDCISFQVMERQRIQYALTADAHFQQAGFEALLLSS